MSDTTGPARPFTFTITVVAGLNSTGVPIVSSYQVQGAFLEVKGETYIITDNVGNVVAATHIFGTIITRNDVTTGL